MDLDIGQILTQIVAFLIMLWILKRFAWKPLLGIMEERKQKIESEFAFIEEQKDEMKRLSNEYTEKLKDIEAEARVKMQEAVKEGQRLAKEIQEETHKQAKATLDKAQDEIQREIAKAKIHLKNDIVNMTIIATEKILQEKLDTEKQKKVVEELINQTEFS